MTTTTKAAHTPGPWRVARGEDEKFIYGPKYKNGDSVYIAALSQIIERDDNARLIAAAPEMLEALERAEKHIACIEGMGSVLTDIRAAIQKARGGQ